MMSDLFSEYMTPAEFADLSSDEHHAVWKANREGRVDSARYGAAGTVHVYNRAQVAELLRELEVPAPVVCWRCRKPIVRCATVQSHFGCGSGYGWIHSDPEQWGHSCEPRSGAPYARPDAPPS